jgi:hypothetical protein
MIGRQFAADLTGGRLAHRGGVLGGAISGDLAVLAAGQNQGGE